MSTQPEPTTPTEKAFAEIAAMQERLQAIRVYIIEHRAAFDSLPFVSTSSIHAGDIKLYCHVVPGKGGEFIKALGTGEWKRENGSEVGFYNWKGRPEGAPCEFVIFNAETREEFHPFITV